MVELAYPMLVVLLGYVVLGITGFGSALIIVPLLAWRWPLSEVVALAILMDIPASILHGGLNLRLVDFTELRRLLPGMAVGTLAGLWLSGVMDPRWPLFALGLYVAAVGINAFRTSAPVAQRRLTAPWAHGMGFAIGTVEMLFGTAGPLAVTWLNRSLKDVHVLRASTPVILIVSASVVLLGMGWTGRLSGSELWLRWASLIGVAVVGVLIGNRIARRVAADPLRKLVYGLLTVSGLTLVLHTWI